MTIAGVMGLAVGHATRTHPPPLPDVCDRERDNS